MSKKVKPKNQREQISLAALETDDDPVATMDDFRIQRDDDEKVMPLKCQMPNGKVMWLTPMGWGEAKVYTREMARKGEVSAKRVAKMMRDHLVAPDGSGVTEADVDGGMLPHMVGAFINYMHDISGLNAETRVEDGTVKVEMEDEGNP